MKIITYYVLRLWYTWKCQSSIKLCKRAFTQQSVPLLVCVFTKKRCQGTKLSHQCVCVYYFTHWLTVLTSIETVTRYFYPIKIEFKVCRDIRDRFEERLDECFFMALFSLLREKGHLYAKIACSIDITGRQFSFRPHNFIDPVALCNNFTLPVLCINLRKISSKNDRSRRSNL